MQNVYFDAVYSENNFIQPIYNCITLEDNCITKNDGTRDCGASKYKCNIIEEKIVKRDDKLDFYTDIEIGLWYTLGKNIAMDAIPKKIDFYQDERKQCFLFSYTQKELTDMKIGAGHNIGYNIFRSQPRFLIEKYGLRLITNKELKKIMPTLQPHPYDPSLCKPKPSDK